MTPVMSNLLLFVLGNIAGFVNVMAGGGSSLTLPALIFLGLDGAVANGTNRVGIFLQSISAVSAFKQQQLSDSKLSLELSLWTLPGAIIGAIFATKINNEWFNRILAIVMIGIVFSMFQKKPETSNNTTNKKASLWLYPSLLLIGFYGGFIQVGVGFIIMAALFHLMKFDLVRVNMHKVFITLVFTIPSLIIFIWSDNVIWSYGLSLAAGNACGGWWAAKLSVKKGEKLIRIVLIITIFLIALKLLQVF